MILPPKLRLESGCTLPDLRIPRSLSWQRPERTDSLFLLDKMTPKLAAKYQKKGIFTLTQLSYVYRPRRRRKGAGKVPTPFNPELQALAIREKKIYLHERPSLPQHPVELFLDIEGIPDQGFNYLVGLLVKQGDTTEMHSFWADGPADERRIFEQGLALAAAYPDAPIYHYGAYERRALERVASQHGIDCDGILGRLVNVNGFIHGKVYFPTRSNRLKDLGAAVGASWPTPDPSGIQSVVWRYRWEDSRDDAFKAKLLAYNQADCNALRLLTMELQSLSKCSRFTVGRGLHEQAQAVGYADRRGHSSSVRRDPCVRPRRVPTQEDRTVWASRAKRRSPRKRRQSPRHIASARQKLRQAIEDHRRATKDESALTIPT